MKIKFVFLLFLSACAVGPKYVKPSSIEKMPAAYKELEGWKVARPHDSNIPERWWELYNDSILNSLETQISISNLTVASAEAQFRQARAVVQAAKAGYFPSVTVGATAARSYNSANVGNGNNVGSTVSNFELPVNLSWELDLWGRTSTKMFVELKGFPKNREARPVYITDEIMEVLNRRMAFKLPANDYVFHVDGSPLNYGTIQINYRAGQRKSGVPYTGTHILRHGMAKLARQVGGGLDAVLAMTGHKDLKLADHYSKSTEDDQKEFSEKIMEHIRKIKLNEVQRDQPSESTFENVLSLSKYRTGTNN